MRHAGAFKKKGEESNGVIAMIDLLVADLDKATGLLCFLLY